jgi:putative FmdB family regulatory protein
MPIYAYKCGSCGHQQDVLQKISDDPLTICPQCNQPSLAKQVTAAGFQLKGSGWYVTDFRDNGAKKDGKAADKPAETTADKTAATTDVKSEPKSDAKTEAKSESKSSTASTTGSTSTTPAPSSGQPSP